MITIVDDKSIIISNLNCYYFVSFYPLKPEKSSKKILRFPFEKGVPKKLIPQNPLDLPYQTPYTYAKFSILSHQKLLPEPFFPYTPTNAIGLS